jgi:hypothetical protein
LWRLARSLTAKRVSVSVVAKQNLRGPCWVGKSPTFDDALSHLEDILRADLRYPIILDRCGHVMDGYHRLSKAVLLRKKMIWAVQFEELPEPDEITRRRWD